MIYQDEDPARTGDYDFCNKLSNSLFGCSLDETDEAYNSRVSLRNNDSDYLPMTAYEIERDLAAAKENQRLVNKVLEGYQARWG
jgi:hypothetical protein